MNNSGGPTRRVRLLVSGRVQGVFFRARTREEAQRLAIAGWVRNLPDGRVEVLAEGESRAITSLIAWCRQGPRFADVSEVEVIEEPPGNEFSSFEIRY